MMDHLATLIASPDIVGKEYSDGGRAFKIAKADDFSYKDPVDSSVAKNQVPDCFTSRRRNAFMCL